MKSKANLLYIDEISEEIFQEKCRNCGKLALKHLHENSKNAGRCWSPIFFIMVGGMFIPRQILFRYAEKVDAANTDATRKKLQDDQRM
jgi:hypothetical protein